MMRIKTLALTALVFLISSCGKKTSNEIEQDKKYTDWYKLKLKGEVKSLREIQYKAVDKFGKIQKGDIDDSSSENVYILFNKKGNLVEWNNYNADGSLDSKWTYKYDEKRDLVRKNEYYYGSLSSKYIYKYDNKGNIVEMNNYKANGNLYSKEKKYSLYLKEKYKYDNTGNVVEMNKYKADGSLDCKNTYKYDDKGNRIEINWDKVWKCTYKYDNKGNEVESNWWHKSDGKLVEKEMYTYDKYDKKGNWNKKIIFKNTIPQTIIEREIVYF